MVDQRVKRRLAVILVADVVGFSRLMDANDEGTLSALSQHRQALFEPAVARHDGRIFKSMGYGFLAEFHSATEAVRCALALQNGLTGRNAGVPDDRHIKLRIGINLGDVILRGGDVFGDDVNIASRLVTLAPPGGIACSAQIHEQIGKKLAVAFADQGERSLKNIAQPVRVYLIEAEAAMLDGKPERQTPGLPRYRSDKPSIAVLPFANMSGDPEQDYFSDGITEDIITDLSKVSELFVLSRNTVFMHKGKAVELDKVANDLGVGYLVDGSVRKAGSKVRITAQLIEGSSGGHLWAERYDRNLTDIFGLQDEITKTIVDQLKVRLLPREKKAIEKAPTNSVEAYTFYLRGREYFHRGSRKNYELAKSMFGKATLLDPEYARAYAGLADCDSFLFMDYSVDSAAEVLKNSEKALALQDDLAEAHASRGMALSVARRYEEAEHEFDFAIALEPNLFEARFFYGRSCYAQGKLEQTALQWERAAEIKPDDYQALILLNQVYASLGQIENANRAGQRGVERAEREFAHSPDNARPAYFIATTLAKMGDAARAAGWAKTALAIAPDDYLTQYNIVCYHSVSGDFDSAFAMLFRLLPISNADMMDWILSDSDLDPLHADPRWRDVMRVAGRK